jgi:protein SHQ1
MITPLFKVDQNENFILLSIQVKYVKISDVDFHIENNNFKFYLKPYFLNLFFSDNLKPDSENNSSSYDVDKGLLDCRIEKDVPGTEFKNLDMVSTLLLKDGKNQTVSENLISKKVEEISGNGANESTTLNQQTSIEEIKQNFLSKIKDEESLNSYLLEIISKETLSSDFGEISLTQNNKKFGYGFNNEFYDVFKNREEERLELLDINPETEQLKHRYFAKMEKENEEFVPERYYYDMNSEEDENLKSAIKLSLDKYIKKYSENNFQFNEKELNTLMTINKTKLSLLEYETNIYFEFYLQSIDILFAFIYDLRLTDFEHNSESGWTVNKLSSVLSNCVDYKNIFYSFSDVPPFDYLEESVKNVLIACYRRALTHPLYRNLELCEKIKNDLVKVFGLENNTFFILKFFLRVRQIFESSEPRHILNKIYVDGYIQWVQSYSMKEVWKILGGVIKKTEISKDEIKLDLNEIENEFKNYEGDI